MRKKVYLASRSKVTKMKQLSKEQRYAIFLYLKEGKTQKVIAEAIGVSKSTISREIKRNSGARGYSFRQAQELADIRKKRLRLPRKMNAEVRQRIEKLMRTEDWSPEQIKGWCDVKGYRMVSSQASTNISARTKNMVGTCIGTVVSN